MQLARAQALLSGLVAGRDPGATVDEVRILAALSAIVETSRDTWSSLRDSAAGIAEAQARLRALRRDADLTWGPKSDRPPKRPAGGAPTPLTPMQLAVQDLEGRSLAQGALLAMVANSATGTYLTITFSGRQMVHDLAAWSPRVPTDELVQFTARLSGLKEAISATVGNASDLADDLSETDQMRVTHAGPSAVRASAIGLALAGQAEVEYSNPAGRLFYFMDRFGHHGETPADRILGATLLAVCGGTTDVVNMTFNELKTGLAPISPAAGTKALDVDLLAAALTQSTLYGRRDALTRATELVLRLRPARPLPLAPLVLASYPVDEAIGRSAAATAELERLGYPAGDATLAAAYLLAASTVPTDQFGARLAALDPKMRSVFPSAALPDALLAAAPLSVPEALELHEYAVAAVSRGAFFNDTQDVDYLALLIADGLAVAGVVASFFAPVSTLPPPPPLPLAAPMGSVPLGPGDGPLPSSEPPATYSVRSALGAAGVVAGLTVPVLLLTHDYWLYRSYIDYAREHPLHSNAVQIVG